MSGKVSMRLSVRISQRNFGGNEYFGTYLILLDLNPTISRFWHCPSTSGSVSKQLFEAKMILSFLSWVSSCGNDDNELLVKSRISRLSASCKISNGNDVKLSDSFKCLMPVN